MAMGQQKDRQGDLMVGWAEMPRSPGHVFYDLSLPFIPSCLPTTARLSVTDIILSQWIL